MSFKVDVDETWFVDFQTFCMEIELAVFGCRSIPYSLGMARVVESWITNLAPAFFDSFLSM